VGVIYCTTHLIRSKFSILQFREVELLKVRGSWMPKRMFSSYRRSLVLCFLALSVVSVDFVQGWGFFPGKAKEEDAAASSEENNSMDDQFFANVPADDYAYDVPELCKVLGVTGEDCDNLVYTAHNRYNEGEESSEPVDYEVESENLYGYYEENPELCAAMDLDGVHCDMFLEEARVAWKAGQSDASVWL
jgi:hypothetical protein